MTDLQAMYARERNAGRGHMAAVKRLAVQLQVDAATIHRTLQRADDLDSRDPGRLLKHRKRSR